MLIKNEFEVAEPVDKVWQFFDNIPQVASCLPGAELTKDLGDDKYEGRVAIRMGPVRLQFNGTADITERDEAAKRIVVHAAGADEKGRGQAAMVVGATLSPKGRGSAVRPGHDLRRLRDLDARLLRGHAGPDRTARARRERGADRRRGRHPLGAGLHDRRAGRADGADAGVPPVLPSLPASGELSG